MKSVFLRTSLSALGTAALLASAASFGQAAATAPQAAGGLEEIVVTATRRTERLQDVPISVAAFSQEKIDSQGLKNIDDLSRLTPGVTFSRNGMGSSANYNDENSDIAIRGIDAQAGDSTTGVYVDDTPVQSRHIGFGAVNVFPALFDVERVEVLRGPQGTLFGAGAEGGAVRFITPSPSLTNNSGYARAEFATTQNGAPSYEAGAAFGGPMIDNILGFRVSASYRRDGGWVDRVSYTANPNSFTTTPVLGGVTEKDANWQQTVTARAALTWAPNANVTVSPSIYYQELQVHDTAAYWQALSNPGDEQFNNGNALRNPSTDPFWIAAVKVEANLGFAQLTSNTSYYKRDQHSASDYTQYLRTTWALFGDPPGGPTIGFPVAGDGGYAPFGDKQKNFYEEIRLASSDAAAAVTWTAGLFFSHTNENIPEDIIDPTLEAETGGNVCASVGVTCPGGLIFHGPEDRIVQKQIAAFGELSYKFLEHFKATVGLRVSKVDVDGTTGSGGAFIGTPLDPLQYTNSSTSEKPVTPKFVLSYQPSRDNMYYLSVAKGYRAGGVNTPTSIYCQPDLDSAGISAPPGTYASDSLWSYEIGAKLSTDDRKLQVNSSLFTIKWKNIQQNVYLPSCGEQFTGNLGQVTSHGGDIDISYKPISSLTLGFSAAYTDARFTQASCAGGNAATFSGGTCVSANGTSPPVVSEGDRLPGAPWTFVGSAEWTTFMSGLDKLGYVRIDYQRTSAQSALLPGQNGENALFDTTIPGLPDTKNLSLRMGLRFSGVDVSVFANNLTNDHPLLFSSRDIAVDSVDTLYFGRSARPRTIGVTATYRY